MRRIFLQLLALVLLVSTLAAALVAADSEDEPRLTRTVEHRGKEMEASGKRKAAREKEACSSDAGAGERRRARVIYPDLGCVTVTGATGFTAGHVIEVLLNKGYTVHGTVRTSTLGNEKKLAHLRALEKRGLGK